MTDQGTPKPAETAPQARVEAARIDAYVAIWTKAVDTQMHFNEMSAKSRQLGLTFVAAALGVSIVLLGRREDFSLPLPFGGLSLHISVVIVLATALAVYAVSILDLNVYHRMLRGAVTFGEDFEENYLKEIVQLDKGMTQAISYYSRRADAKVRTEGSRYRYEAAEPEKRAQNKIQHFYNVVIVALVTAALIIFVATCNSAQNATQTKTSAPDAGVKAKAAVPVSKPAAPAVNVKPDSPETAPTNAKK